MDHNLAVESLYRELGDGLATAIDDNQERNPYFYFIDKAALEVTSCTRVVPASYSLHSYSESRAWIHSMAQELCPSAACV